MKDIIRAGIVEDYFDHNRRQYVIPVYQRNYEWAQKQCVKLFDDIILAAHRKKNHFCGSVVCAQLETAESQVESFIVIDGQQRLTTIYLLLIAMRDKLEKGHTLDILNKTLTNEYQWTKCQGKTVRRVRQSRCGPATVAEGSPSGARSPAFVRTEIATMYGEGGKNARHSESCAAAWVFCFCMLTLLHIGGAFLHISRKKQT